MTTPKSENDVTVDVTGQTVGIKTGRVAAKSTTRTGVRKHGKSELEVIVGHEFNSAGQMVKKERVIDRSNNRYRELVVNVDTSQVLRDVEELLSDHLNRGSAKGDVGDR
jgi:hypothetical protein